VAPTCPSRQFWGRTVERPELRGIQPCAVGIQSTAASRIRQGEAEPRASLTHLIVTFAGAPCKCQMAQGAGVDPVGPSAGCDGRRLLNWLPLRAGIGVAAGSATFHNRQFWDWTVERPELGGIQPCAVGVQPTAASKIRQGEAEPRTSLTHLCVTFADVP